MATLTKRPANLPDKTYGAPVGYAYFDIFNTGSRLPRPWFSCQAGAQQLFPQVEQGEDDLADDHRQRVGQDVLLLLVRRLWRWGHHQPQDLQVRKWQVIGHGSYGTTVDEWFGIFMLWCDRKTYDGTDVDRMDDDYHDFFRQDISEGKDDDEDRDIPSVSTFEMLNWNWTAFT